jgi:DNA-binding transcriptional MerR regulator
MSSLNDFALAQGRIPMIDPSTRARALFTPNTIQKLKAISEEKLNAVRRLISKSPRMEDDLLNEILTYNTAIILDLEKELNHKLTPVFSMEARVIETGRKVNFNNDVIDKLLEITDEEKLNSIFSLLRMSPDVSEKGIKKILDMNTEKINEFAEKLKKLNKSKEAGGSGSGGGSGGGGKRTRRLRKN